MRGWSGMLLVGLFLTGLAGGLPAAEEEVDYTDHIKPLLKKHCIRCHGEDKQEGGLRVDTAEATIKGGDRGEGVIPGKAKESLLYQALLGEVEDMERMPLEGSEMSADEIELIKQWIDAGAHYPEDEQAASSPRSKHWAFQPIARPVVPAANQAGRILNPIDAFILARLAGLPQSPEAEKTTLLRRLSLDLRGVPPTPEEAEEFLADAAPDAYERWADRLLASPQYGERWGRHWLDLARYADSHGFTIDGPRLIWKYRDWVIQSINANQPFDEFAREQLAGDLLPQPSQSQLIATGFHRNTLINQEGGTDPEQFRVESIVDRVNTTGSVFLGLTVGCAQCHTHKYDPITQREYYELFAIFNNCDEPTLSFPTDEQTAELNRINQEIAAVNEQLKQRQGEPMPGVITDPALITWETASVMEAKSQNGVKLTPQEDLSILASGPFPDTDIYALTLDAAPVTTAVKLEAMTHDSLPKRGPGTAGNGNFVLDEFRLKVVGGANPREVPLKSAWADHEQDGHPAKNALDRQPNTGWAINVASGSLNVDRQAIFLLAEPLTLTESERLVVELTFADSQPKKYLLGRFRISVTEQKLNLPDEPLENQLADLTKRRQRINQALLTTMILRERSTPRATHVMIRGDFLRHGPQVRPGVPAALPALVGTTDSPNRLDLANWLFSPEHPLTARVTVNRYWQHFFGKGLVETENDFGLQGAPPSHPELLDWLASEFQRLGWDVKALHRLIVTSATYRQSSVVTPELWAADQGNRWLARQSRIRLEAETIRDACLAASGLLSPKMLGPSVYPPQPAGIYVLTQNQKAWPVSQGADRWRRGIYTYFWRSSPDPFLATFDAPAATQTCTRRSPSNTPLQALTLANDQMFLELALGLAERLLREQHASDIDRIHRAWQLCFSRTPTEPEAARAERYLQTQRQNFQSQPAQAARLLASLKANSEQPAELAAWVALSRVLMNLDEMITRE